MSAASFTTPALVVVVDDSLVSVPIAGVTFDVSPDTVLLMTTSEAASEWRERLGWQGPLQTLEPGERAAGQAQHYSYPTGRFSRLTAAKSLRLRTRRLPQRVMSRS